MSLQEVSSAEELENAIDSNEQVMVVFSKEQCPACNTMGNWLNTKFIPEQSQQRPVKVVMAKLEKIGRSVVEDFSLRTMPTTLLFNKGDEVYRVAGFQGPAPVINALNTHLQPA